MCVDAIVPHDTRCLGEIDLRRGIVHDDGPTVESKLHDWRAFA